MNVFGRSRNGSVRAQQYASTSPSPNRITDDDLTWEENYRIRARAMTRDYVNPNSTRISHRRSRSADSRTQYNKRDFSSSGTFVTNNNSYNPTSPPNKTNEPPRTGCFNIFAGDETRARVGFDQKNFSNYPSQLPRASEVHEIQYGRRGRLASRDNFYSEGGGRPRSRSTGRAPQAPSGMVDPYQSFSFSSSRNSFDALPRSVSTSTSTHSTSPSTRTPLSMSRFDYDASGTPSNASSPAVPLKDSLLMFGEEQSSNGTGLSQQELLQRKEREETIALRKEKKQRHSPGRNKVVNLPSSLFPLHTNRQQQQLMQQQKNQQQEHQVQQLTSTTKPLQLQNSQSSFYPTQTPRPQIKQLQPQPIPEQRPVTSSDHNVGSFSILASNSITGGSSSPSSFSNSSPNYSHQLGQTPVSSSSIQTTPQKSSLETGDPEPISPDPPAGEAGTLGQSQYSRSNRSAMINRMRGRQKGTERRWNIIPSLSRSGSGADSPTNENQSRSEASMKKTEAMYASIPKTTSPQTVEDDDGSTDYKLDRRQMGLDSQAQHAMVNYSSEDSREYNLATAQPQRGQDFSRFSVNGMANEDVAREAAAEILRAGREQSHNGGGYRGNGEQGVRTSSSYPGFYDRRDAGNLAFPLQTQGTDPTGRSNQSSREFRNPSASPFAQFSSMAGSGMNVPASFDTSELPSTFNRKKSDENNTRGTRKAGLRYTLEPKDYSKMKNYNAERSARMRNASIESTSFSAAMFSPVSNDASYRATDPFSPFDDKISGFSGLNNPSGFNMSRFAASSRSEETPSRFGAQSSDSIKQRQQSKISPTSVTDIQNPNVRWSDNLDQLPTPRRVSTEKPKSILRKSRTRSTEVDDSDCPSDETPSPTKAVRISNRPVTRGQFISDHPTAMGFVDNDGRALSPISKNSLEFVIEENGLLAEGKLDMNASGFEKNIPEEFQQAFLAENAVSKTDNLSGQMSAAYSDFIESVASVVVQTAARQFLAKLAVQRMRKQTRANGYSERQKIRQKLGKKVMLVSKRINSSGISKFDRAAIQIQSVYRGWYTRDCITVDTYCANIIQRNFRAHLQRRRYLYDRYRVIQVQSLARRKMAFDIFATCMYCVVVIQSAFRGHKVRKSIRARQRYHRFIRPSRTKSQIKSRTKPMNRHRAATLIQAQWRCFACEMAFLRTYEDILLVQSIARGWVARRLVRSWLRVHNVKASRRLMGPQLQPQKESTGNYKIPRSYRNHTQFIRNNLPSQVHSRKKEMNSGHARSMDVSNGAQPSSRRTWTGSNENKMGSNVHHTANVRRRLREQEELRRVASGESQRRERERQGIAQVTGKTAQESRYDTKAAARHQHQEHKYVASKLRPVSFSKDSNYSNAAPCDQRMDDRAATSKAVSTKKEKQRERMSAIAALESKDSQTGSHVEEIRAKKRRMEMEARARRQQEDQRKSGDSAGASRILAGWRERETKSSIDKNEVLDNDSSEKRPSWKSELARKKKKIPTVPSVMIPTKTSIDSSLDTNASDRRRAPEWKRDYSVPAIAPVKAENLSNANAIEDRSKMLARPQAGSQARRRRIASNTSGSKFHATMRSKRALSEQQRLDEIHQIFVRVGLMSSAVIAESHLDYHQLSSKEDDRLPASAHARDHSQEVLKDEKENAVSGAAVKSGKLHDYTASTSRQQQPKRQSAPLRSVVPTTIPTEDLEKLDNGITDEKKDDVFIAESEQVNSFSPTVNDSYESKNLPKIAVPSQSKKLHALARKPAPTPTAAVELHVEAKVDIPEKDEPMVTSAEDIFKTLRSSEPENNGRVPKRSVPPKRTIASSKFIHVEMRAIRTEAEQARLEEIHDIFLRVGLMGRREQGKEKMSFAEISSKEYETKMQASQSCENNDSGLSPSALIQDWRGRPQSQPIVRGKLF